MTPDEALAGAKAIASIVRDVSLAGGLFYILRGGRDKLWVWGWQLEQAEKRESACKADYEARLLAAEKREAEWKEMALETRHVARDAVDIVKKRSDR